MIRIYVITYTHMYMCSATRKLWPNKCYLAHTESTNGTKKTWRMADFAVGTIRVYFPHTDEFVPENCGIRIKRFGLLTGGILTG